MKITSYCVGNLIGPQLFFQREKPRYQSGFASWIVCFVAQFLIAGILYVIGLRENRRVRLWRLLHGLWSIGSNTWQRERLASNAPPPERGEIVAFGFSDKTDVSSLLARVRETR